MPTRAMFECNVYISILHKTCSIIKIRKYRITFRYLDWLIYILHEYITYFHTGLKSYSVVKQHAFIPSHSGDSVNLTCTVLNQTCVGNHSVYWLIHESQESHPRIIGAHGTSTDQCDRISESGFTVRRCVYSFSMKDLNLSDAGTYNCAVVACGEILLGNGTKLDIIGMFFNN